MISISAHLATFLLLISSIRCVDANVNTGWTQQQLQRHPFVCRSGALLDAQRLCDGRRDCQDGSDESHHLCARTMCPPDSFRCHYGACVLRQSFCDGVRDCADGSDEEACGRRRGSCARHQFRCKRSGHCIDAASVCDGHRNCPLIDYLYDRNNDDDAEADGIADALSSSSDESVGLCSVAAICPRDAFRCSYGGCVPAAMQCDGFADCLDASDESTVLCMAADCVDCRQAIRCPAIDVRRLDAVCEVRLLAEEGADSGGGSRVDSWLRVPCNQSMPTGTMATYSCSEFFEPDGSKHQHNDMSRCQRDGTWSRDPLRCRPLCGRRRITDAGAAVPLVVRGQAVSEPFPWHVSMYVRPSTAKRTDSLANFRFWCGATLISESIVITAAHCVWGVQADAMRLVIGGTSSHYFEKEAGQTDDNNDNTNSTDYASELYERTLSVRQIRMHPLYQDRYGNYGSDMALLELTAPLELGVDALPVCIDWQLDDISEQHLQHASLGMVMGMGVSEQNAFGDRLRWTALPVVDHAVCLERQRRDFRKYVTFTTFCAGWANGTGVCNGDSGGGLVFESQGRRWTGSTGGVDDYGDGRGGGVWFLQGIVSLSPRSQQTMQCDPFAYTIFTKVGMYVQWISNQVRQMHEHERHTVRVGATLDQTQEQRPANGTE